MTVNLQLVAAQYLLDYVDTDALASAATEALLDGIDSPSIRRLAGMKGADPTEAQAVFSAALGELQIQSPTAREAAMLVATDLALRITQGKILPYDGAKQIWRIHTGFSEEHLQELDPFVYAASEWEVRPDDRDYFAAAIVAAAGQLVRAQVR